MRQQNEGLHCPTIIVPPCAPKSLKEALFQSDRHVFPPSDTVLRCRVCLSEDSGTTARSKISKNNLVLPVIQETGSEYVFASQHPHFAVAYSGLALPRPPNFLALRKREVCCFGPAGCQRRANKRKWVRLLLSSPQSITGPLVPRLR